MNCMKCGKETKEPQVFCESCLAVMQKYPVKPDVRVQIPVRPSTEGKPAAKKEPPSLESQIRRLRKLTKHLFVALLCSLLALTLAVVLLFRMNAPEPPANNIGKNYSTVDTNNRP